MSDNGQQVPLIERLRSVPAAARVLEHTPNPLGYDTTSIPVGALCQEAAARIDELERERDQYHDALIARHGGEPVALLGELDDARARIADLETKLINARIELQRMQSGDLPGGWTDELNGQIQARHRAEAELAAERERREAAEAVIHTCQWAIRQPLDGWKGECERKALDEARAHFARYKD